MGSNCGKRSGKKGKRFTVILWRVLVRVPSHTHTHSCAIVQRLGIYILMILYKEIIIIITINNHHLDINFVAGLHLKPFKNTKYSHRLGGRTFR